MKRWVWEGQHSRKKWLKKCPREEMSFLTDKYPTQYMKINPQKIKKINKKLKKNQNKPTRQAIVISEYRGQRTKILKLKKKLHRSSQQWSWQVKDNRANIFKFWRKNIKARILYPAIWSIKCEGKIKAFLNRYGLIFMTLFLGSYWRIWSNKRWE